MEGATRDRSGSARGRRRRSSPNRTTCRPRPDSPGTRCASASTRRSAARAGDFACRTNSATDRMVIEAAHVARATSRDAIDPSTDVALRFGGHESLTLARGEAATSRPDFILGRRLLRHRDHALSVAPAPSGVDGTSGLADDVVHRAGKSGLGGDPRECGDDVALVRDQRRGSASRAPPAPSWCSGIRSPTDAARRTTRTTDGPTTSRIGWRSPRRKAGARASPCSTRESAATRSFAAGSVRRRWLDSTRDVLSQAGVRWVIVCEGVNDIGGSRAGFGGSRRAATDRRVRRHDSPRARARDSRVRRDVMPFGGSQYSSPEHEAARATVNAWIRTSGAFDAVIDFDAATMDPGDPSRLRADVDGGDHLHPSEAGYR